MTDFRIKLVTAPAVLFQRLKHAPWRELYNLAIGIVIIASLVSSLGNGYYMGKWMGLGVALAMLLALKFYERFGMACGAMLGYLALSTVWVIAADSRYTTLNPYDLMALRYYSSESLIKLLLVSLPFLALGGSRYDVRGIGRFLVVVFCLVSLWQVFWEASWHGCAVLNSCGGALKNPSLNDAMMAVCLPILEAVFPFGWAFVIPVALASMLGKSAIGTGMCALYVTMTLWGKGLYGRLSIMAAIPTIILTGYLTHGHKSFFDSSGRFQMWVFFMKLWAVNWRNWLTGTGFGTFGIFSNNLQQAFKTNPSDWWIWMHNDWLQMAFECGIVGLAIMIWLYITCLIKLYIQGRAAPELKSLLLFGVMMGCEYSLHIAPCCLFAAWIAAIALVQPKVPTTEFAD